MNTCKAEHLTCKSCKDSQSSTYPLHVVDDSKGRRSSGEFQNHNERGNDHFYHNKQPERKRDEQ